MPEASKATNGEEPIHAIPLGPDVVLIPDKYTVERGIVGASEQEAVVIVFILQGHEVRFALAAPNAADLAETLKKNAAEARDFQR